MKNIIAAIILLSVIIDNSCFAQGTDVNFSPKQAISSGFADIVEEIMPAVVNISTIQEVSTNSSGIIDQTLLNDLQKSPLFEEFRNRLENQYHNQLGQKKKISSIGSGFIISKDGFIVTNSHVIDEASEININLNDGSKYKAKLVGIDKKTDLALLKINSEKELKFVKFGDSSKSRIGDWVIVVGNPYGLGGSVSVGIISARSRDINNGQSEEFIQTDAAINKGNSGGPMFNYKGEVIGISTAIFSPSGGSVGIGFATPSSTANQVIKQLKDQGEVIRGWIGVSVQDISAEMAESMNMEKVQGAFVIDVAKNGPAQKAGILPTDIIIKLDDQDVSEMKTLPKLVTVMPIGKLAKITVLRQGKVKTFIIKIEKMKSDEEKKQEVSKSNNRKIINKPSSVQFLGLSVAEPNFSTTKDDDLNSANKGLLVVEINPKSEAAEKGISVGDVILSVNQIPVSSIKELRKIIDSTQKENKKLFFFLKRGAAKYAVVLQTTK